MATLRHSKAKEPRRPTPGAATWGGWHGQCFRTRSVKATSAASVLVLVLVACAVPVAQSPADGVRGRSPRSLAHQSAVLASFGAPTQAPYAIDALGVTGSFVHLRLTNVRATTVELGDVRVAFTAVREGVSFPCEPHVGHGLRRREPAELGPGQFFVFEREIECSMPLPGRYEVGVFVATAATPAGRGDFVGTFQLEVVGKGAVPRPYPSRPGLYVALAANRIARPMPREASVRGEYSVVLAIVNGGRGVAALGPAQLSFLTFKRGSTLPCVDQAEPLALPSVVESGRVHVVRVPIGCAPEERGDYQVVARMKFDDDRGEGIEIGRVGVTVTAESNYMVTGDPPFFRLP
jgi:hypothetical protein